MVPLLLTAWLLRDAYATGIAWLDFRNDFWSAGHQLLHGGDLYSWTRPRVAAGISFPYPAFTAFFFAPFSLLPVGIAGVLFATATVLVAAIALRACGARDWRLAGLVLLWAPVVSAWQTGNLTFVLAAGLACVWLYRDRPWVAGCASAIVISLKPVAIPLLLWLVATRRYRAAARCAVTGLVMNAVAFTVIGVDAVSRWLHLLSVQGRVLYAKGYGVIATAAHVGVGRSGGTAVLILATLLGAATCIWLGVRGRERAAFAAAIALMLVVSPQVDLHYFALLIVPLALTNPGLTIAWVLPLVLWFCPAADAVLWQEAVWWVTVAATVTLTVLTAVERPPAPARRRPEPALVRMGLAENRP